MSWHFRHDLDPDALTEKERLAKRRYDAFFVFETMPLERTPAPGCIDDEQVD
jgi:hypothetical protein